MKCTSVSTWLTWLTGSATASCLVFRRNQTKTIENGIYLCCLSDYELNSLETVSCIEAYYLSVHNSNTGDQQHYLEHGRFFSVYGSYAFTPAINRNPVMNLLIAVYMLRIEPLAPIQASNCQIDLPVSNSARLDCMHMNFLQFQVANLVSRYEINWSASKIRSLRVSRWVVMYTLRWGLKYPPRCEMGSLEWKGGPFTAFVI